MDLDVVSFHLPGHGDAVLNAMNSLRTQQHFCDVTIVAGGRHMFRGHKVVLAACSVFLRDQFLMNPSAELQVSMLHSSTVVFELLQSCYTGKLEFSSRDIVNYLTAASYLQMEHVVERCRGALSQYLQPQNSSLVPTSNKSVQTIKPNDESMPVIVSVRGSDASSHLNTQDEYESDVVQVIIDDLQMAEKTSGAEEDDREATIASEDLCQLEKGAGFSAEMRMKDSGLQGRQRYGRGGRAKGFKRRKRYVFKKDRALLGSSHESWCFPVSDDLMANFRSDFQCDDQAQEHLEGCSIQDEKREVISPDGGLAHFGVSASSGVEGMGIATTSFEHGAADESVVGSTSSGTGPVVCKQCGLIFTSTQELSTHCLSSHKQYVCPCCGKQFAQSKTLNRHMKVHRDSSRLPSCPLCHKTFTQKTTMYDHMNVHSGERPYICAYCPFRFAHRSALRRHLLEQHGKTMPQNHEEMQRKKEVVGEMV
ncbi:hypothetical protein DNTS_004384 [Danionella cerebrum]|uniref:BTB domain-containing protein n=1 Tax=Danionella cerebrum TaxID=2873325 RepID=A0A553RDY7_9TELE|nr:hypothetical protein DNTS_004384 [Danionella translucida]